VVHFVCRERADATTTVDSGGNRKSRALSEKAPETDDLTDDPAPACTTVVGSPIVGLHHVTATVDDAQDDLDFCVGALGLRLVKKTVNFDNHRVYHFYYGDERGTPGTIWTTFPYKGHGVRLGSKGTGQVTMTAFSVPSASLDAWRTRLRERRVSVLAEETRFGDDVLVFADPAGLSFELVANHADTRQPWTGADLDDAAAIRGLHSVTLTIARPPKTLGFLNRLFGIEVAEATSGRTRLALDGGGPGRTIDIVHAADAPAAVNGVGTVHHVALAVQTPDDQLKIRHELVRIGWKVTEVMDRQYFQSIYFREPGGVLLEVATMQPGFTIDEPLSDLGCDLKLPAWEEPNRPSIEAGLARVRTS
jgi:glyoxalase family protein